ncbi:MAG: BrnA antitoxin family protein [Alphaproteobacteria bacterium]
MVKKIKQSDPEMIDDENPEWTADDFAAARPARDVLREQFGEAAAAEMLKPKQRGRPRLATPKVLLSLYFSPDVIDYFRSTGAGWQARMDGALREWIQSRTQ